MTDPSDDSLLLRADAAERTVEVLKKKVFELYNGGSKSALHRQLEKARRRDEDNRRKREIVELRAAELTRYSERLEAEVARRTEAIKTILDNVTFGFMVINRELIVQPESTRSCERLFGTSKVEGSNLCELLGVEGRASLSLVLGIDQVFEDLLPTDASIAQIPKKFTMRDGHCLRVDVGVVRSKTSEITGLLLTISDITALEAATRESNNNRTLVSILKQRESFRSFLADATHQLDAARRAVTEGNQSLTRHALHTIKGNSASYGLDEVVDVIHAIEDLVELTSPDVERVNDTLTGFLKRNHRVLEIDMDELGEEGFAVSREQMSDLRSLISSIKDGEAGKLHAWTARVLRKPAWQLFGPVDDFAQKLATRLGKTISCQLNGLDSTVDAETVRPVAQVLTHLIRNAVDHGLEAPIERRNKPRVGKLELELTEKASAYVLRCSDDGRGIDTDALGRRAVELGLVSAERVASMTEREKMDLVFIEGLSTAAVTTSISGRGVGMSAVRTAVEKAGGEIELRSGRGEGTTFVVTIPKGAHVAAMEAASSS
jgi:two-component system, chemotaxis family, sensor kinase CheA